MICAARTDSCPATAPTAPLGASAPSPSRCRTAPLAPTTNRQLPERLGVRLPPAAPGAPPADPAAASAPLAAAVSSAADSDLLRRLLAEALSPAASGAAGDALSLLDERAARGNDYAALFRSRERFPEVRTPGCAPPPASGLRRSGDNRPAPATTCCLPRHTSHLLNPPLPAPPLPQVFERAKAVSAAEAHLQSLLPRLARAAGVGRLSYVSVQNQGDFLLELPADRASVPQGWVKVCATKKVQRARWAAGDRPRSGGWGPSGVAVACGLRPEAGPSC